METGLVKFFNETKGYGFIIDDKTSEQIFVHATGLKEDVKEGDEVEYKLIEGKKGINAIEVKKV
jgi:CspA family cold shock protein